MPEDERDKLSAHAECVLTARFLSKDHREDLVTATANVGKLALSTVRREEYYDPKEREAFSELRVKGLIDYQPRYQLDEILTQVIDYFRKK